MKIVIGSSTRTLPRKNKTVYITLFLQLAIARSNEVFQSRSATEVSPQIIVATSSNLICAQELNADVSLQLLPKRCFAH
jgi:hypothetical protein